ncbi:MAG: sigma-70 family RNA polymerase sigma factor [Rhodobacteraceae bacterium]|nr:sigma-70 family RNA polymerase sigma factor [Paracoccaceae bacterium]
MTQAALAHAFKADSGRVLASLIAQFRDFDLAEEALQDAMIEAARTWPKDGTPSNAGAWLLAVARRRALDRMRLLKRARDEALQQNLSLLAETPPEDEAAQEIPDERLRLIFTCCHPALSQEAQVALTLRTLCGLTAREIAQAFLVPHTTMNQRLTRAKAKIRNAAIPYRVPEGPEIEARLAAVLSVIYLIFNAGYSPRSPVLSAEALRLCEVVHHLQPLPETAGLWALMSLHMARDPARLNTLISLKDQDRTLWDHPAITRAITRLLHALAQSRPGPYQIQAAISALHCEAASWAETDWPQILALYGALFKLSPTPVVALNHAVAKAHAGAPKGALASLEALASALEGYQPFHAARAELLAQCGQAHAARLEYDRAIGLTSAPEEQAFLRKKLSDLP